MKALDDPDVRTLTVDVLRELGYTVLEADDGPAALQLLEQHSCNVDLLFTDIVLPGGMNGVQVATAAMTKYPTLRVLLTTGYSRNAITRGGKFDGDVDIISKPFSYEQLAEKMRLVFRRSKSHTLMSSHRDQHA